MKYKISFILFVAVAFLSFKMKPTATTYYVSATGSNSNNGTSSATPFQTIAKAVSMVSTNGDVISLKGGDTFNEAITVPRNNITFNSYGTGQAVVSGFTTVGSFSQTGNIWESTSTYPLSTCNILSINGANYAMGRSPNTGYWTIGSTNGSTTITDNSHLNTGNWSGAEVVVRELMYEVNKHTISGHSSNTLTFGAGSITANWGYFVQNSSAACDVQNEWYYRSNKVGVYSTTQPTVKIPTIETGVNMNSKTGVTFSNIKFEGFNTDGINTTSSSGITITGCTFSFMGVNAIYAYPNSSGLTVTNCTFTDCGSRAIHGGSSSNAVFTGNTVNRIGHYAGMGSNGDDSYTGIICNGDNSLCAYNTITNVGYCGIRWDGNGTVIKGNYVDGTNYVKDDGGGIYCYQVQAGNNQYNWGTTRLCRDNIVRNSYGAPDGSPYGRQGMGVYMDGKSSDIDCSNNTVENCYLGIFQNGGRDITIDSNKTFNNTYGYYVLNIGAEFTNTTITNNYFIAKETGQYSAYFDPAGSAMPSNFAASNNCYGRPINEATGWIIVKVSGSNQTKTLAQWQTFTGKESGSVKSYATVASADKIILSYNTAGETKSVSLPGTCVDVKTGTNRIGSVSLPAYGSTISLLITGALPTHIKIVSRNAAGTYFTWTSGTETNLAYYRVDKSTDNGKTWKPLGTVTAKGSDQNYALKL